MAITPRGRAPTAATGERPEANRGNPAGPRALQCRSSELSCIWFQLPMLPCESRTERKRRFLFNKSCGHAAWKLLDLCLPPVNLMRAAIDVGSAKKRAVRTQVVFGTSSQKFSIIHALLL